VDAESVVKSAREQGVFIRENPELGGLLSKLESHEDIPPELCRVVAEILTFVYGISKQTAK